MGSRVITIVFVALIALWTGLWWGSFLRSSCGWPQDQESLKHGNDNLAGSVPQSPAKAETQQNNACPYYFSATEALNVKVTDILLALFTIVLAVKTSGLDKATRGLQIAAIEQGLDTKRALEIASNNAAAAQRAADISERALVASNRPWIKVGASVAGPVSVDENGMHFRVRFTMTNVGASPAQNVWINAKVIAPALGTGASLSLPHEVVLFVAEAKSGRITIPGYPLFPGDHLVQDYTVSITRESLNSTTREVKIVAPLLIWCAEYRSGFALDKHVTASSAMFTAEGRTFAPDIPEIPEKLVRLMRTPLDGSYAD